MPAKSENKAEAEAETALAAVAQQAPTAAIVHPLVLLSVVDHFNRVARNTKKRVLGVLLGHAKGGVVHVANSYARTH